MIEKNGAFLFILLVVVIHVAAQNPYVLNGDATQDNCHCYTLTTQQQNQSGSIWNKNKIDLTQAFDYYFNVYLGCLDTNGADGIVFVLQPVSTSLGSTGEGIGFAGIVPSVGVTIDTYQNFNDNDPAYDHVAIQANGDVDHNSPNNLAGPVPALASGYDIENCQWHTLRIHWQPDKKLIDVYIDGSLRISLQQDIVATIFKNDPLVYWGFTAATGGLDNVQKVCTELDAKFGLAAHDNTCIGTPLTFIDSSVSFGNISDWYWNFDDGTTSNEKNPPAHTYASPGIYNVTLNVLGGEGCLSDTSKQQITIGSFPVADFKTNVLPICTNRNAVFTDATTLDVGTEDYWYWNFGDGETSNEQNPSPVNYAVGNYNVQFYVKTKEGCASDITEKNFNVLQGPGINFTSKDAACKNDSVQFTAQNLTSTNPIKNWYWNFDDNTLSVDSNILHKYSNSGNYNVSLVARAANGCLTDSIVKPVTIYATNANAGNDSTIILGYPYQLQATGGDNYTWSPSTGLDNPFISNPVTTLYNDITYTVTASTIIGCATTDTVHLKVVKGPEIYVPSAFTPNGDGKNDRFKIIPVGIAEISFYNILNRWGQVIYTSKNSSEGWDGTVHGVPQPAGTYVWVVAGKTLDNKIIKKQGTVVLIR
ncbi:MAG: PKD domain-containing protein [Parafilimonas sp.]